MSLSDILLGALGLLGGGGEKALLGREELEEKKVSQGGGVRERKEGE